jgi:hypothetical protein
MLTAVLTVVLTLVLTTVVLAVVLAVTLRGARAEEPWAVVGLVAAATVVVEASGEAAVWPW